MNERPYILTDDEANLIKDILKVIGKPENRRAARELAADLNMPIRRFDKLLDSTFIKLGNGRLTVYVDGVKQDVKKE